MGLLIIAISQTQANVLPKDTFRLANEALNRGAVDDAIQLYQSIADNGFKSLPLYYNLGSAYATKKAWAPARFYLEKAQLEDPLNSDVQRNLELVKDAVADPYRYPKYPLFSLIESVHSRIGSNTFNWLWLMSFLLLAGGLLAKYVNLVSYPSGLIWAKLFLFLLIGILVFFEQTYVRFHSRMVILYEESPLYHSPDEYAESVAELQEGHKLRILEDLGSWAQVDCADGTQGWIPTHKTKPLKKGRS